MTNVIHRPGVETQASRLENLEVEDVDLPHTDILVIDSTTLQPLTLLRFISISHIVQLDRTNSIGHRS